MKALRFERTGSLADLALVDQPTPEPREDEVRVRVHAAGLNPSDLKNVLGRFPYTTLPRIPGRDFAGVVDAGPAEWLGKAVWGSDKTLGFTRDGSHAESLCLPVNALAVMPESLGFARAAACGVPWLTALEAVERASVRAGSRVVVIGAAGAVGRASSQLAAAQHAEVFGIVRRDAQRNDVPDGIDSAVAAEPEALLELIRARFSDGAEVVIDTTGHWLGATVQTLAEGGRGVVIAAPASGIDTLPLLDFYRRGATLIGVNSLLHDGATCAVMFNALATRFEQGLLPPPPEPKAWPLADAVAAYQALEAGGAGKMVLVP